MVGNAPEGFGFQLKRKVHRMKTLSVLVSGLILTASFGSVSHASSTQLVTLLDNEPIPATGFLPSIPMGKFRTVVLFGQTSAATNVGLDCRFTLDPVADFFSSPTVDGFEANLFVSGITGGTGSVLGPNMLCRATCFAGCGGTLTVKALLSK